MADTPRIGLDEGARHFEELEDPRATSNRRHPPSRVVVLALMAVRAGASGPTALAKWALLKRELVRKARDRPNGIPCQDVFPRVLGTRKPGAFPRCFAHGLESPRSDAAVATGGEQPVWAGDGQTVRRSQDRENGLGALPAVRLGATEFGLTLGQVARDAKSNEITAIPELLKRVDLQGALLTIDARGPPNAIAARMSAGEADSVLALKGDQEMLHQAVIHQSDEPIDDGLPKGRARRSVTTEAGHGRDETRTDRQLPAPESPPGFTLGNGLKSIGVVMSECVRDGNATLEVRYSLSGLDLGVKRCARAIRRHWGIENACHGSLDVTEREEEARIRDEVPREDFAWLTRFTLSLLKQHPGRASLAMKRRSRGWSDDFLMQVLTGKAI